MHRFSSLRDRAEMLVPPLPWDHPHWADRGGAPVVLLHGLWRGWRAMEPLARVLRAEGFSTLNLPYPSTRLPIPRLVDHVRGELQKIEGDQPVHFVTHSLGGIIARALLAEYPPATSGRLIMLAPPNSGSEIIDWSKNHPALRRMLGPAGRALGSDGVPGKLPALAADTEAAVIMGRHAALPLFAHLLEKDNDGIVSVGRGKVPGLRGFAVVDADHTFIQMHPDAVRLILRFLKTGSLEP